MVVVGVVVGVGVAVAVAVGVVVGVAVGVVVVVTHTEEVSCVSSPRPSPAVVSTELFQDGTARVVADMARKIRCAVNNNA